MAGKTGKKRHLGPFEIGQIKAHMSHGLGPLPISRHVVWSDGTGWSDTAISNAMEKISKNPHWQGERKVGSGAQRKTTARPDGKIIREVIRNRGKRKVTVKHLRRTFPELKDVGNTLIESRLHDAGLAWLKRRRKTIVEEKHLQPRLDYANYVSHVTQEFLDKWAYSDGTVFYRDRTPEESEHGKRRALGVYVWRRSDASDALYEDCIGPSKYNKAQGEPIRVWGLLADGILHVCVLPKGQVMNRWWYSWLIEARFHGWLGNCKYLVQDYERCLRCEEPLEAMRSIDLKLVDKYPKASPDLNAIENAWNFLRERLDETYPTKLEDRDDFIRRLHNAVSWVNRNKGDALLTLSRNQKRRAQDVMNNDGGRTQW